MNKAERLFQLVTYLRSRRTVITAQELASRFNVSERTIYRDVQSLSLSGVSIEGEAGVGYLLKPNTTIAPLMFSEAEIEAVVLGMRLVRSSADDELRDHADSALTKIRSVLSEPLMHRLNHRTTSFVVPEFGRQEKAKFGPQIRQAIQQKKTLIVQYEDVTHQVSERELKPLGLLFWGSSWTLAAWCQLREDYRSFRLDRIAALKLNDTQFEEDDHSLQTYLEKQGSLAQATFWPT